MTCLTVTPASAAEAVRERADLVVAHHPLPFRPLNRITTDSTAGRLLVDLIGAEVALYSPHTAFDSARSGINQHLATGIGLQNIEPLMPTANSDKGPDLGAGRCGRVGGPTTLEELVARVKSFLGLDYARIVGNGSQPVERVGVACGSGGSFLATASQMGCDCLVTGETNFHTCLEAEAGGTALVLTGHFASERFAMSVLADHLSEQLPNLHVWASEDESDPLHLA